jgi:RHS repeat-associated protein
MFLISINNLTHHARPKLRFGAGKGFASLTHKCQNITIIKNFQYDHASRLLAICHRISEPLNGLPAADASVEEFPHLLNQITYNEIGQMIRKDMGRLPNKTRMENPDVVFAESQAFDYNIRGWWNSSFAYNKLDKKYIQTDGKIIGATANFEHSLSYNFNGNIKESIWEGNGGQIYTYDGLNRLVSAIGKVNSPTKFEETISYDRNGNIETLLRKNAGGFTIDDLKYNYKANSPNQLDYVNDVASTTKKEEGFPARTGATNDFTYDANGNLLNDVARGISTTYNLLNLVNTVTTSKGTQNYTYAADGTKISFTPGVGINKTYIGAVEYNTGGTILRIGTEEGHVMLRPLWNENSKDSKYVYYYTIKDHLGNVRMVLDDDANANIWQKTDYNAFGLDAKNDFPQGISAGKERNNHLYNDKESDPETTRLDYGARQYDNVLGRWFVVDRFSEKYSNLSGYQYGGNNPILNIDVNGDSTYRFDGNTGAYLGMFDLDAVGQIGSFGTMKTIGKGKNKQEIWDGQYFDFADPINDTKNIREGQIEKIEFITESDIQSIMKEQGAFESGKINFAWQSQGSKKFDYHFTILNKKYPEAKFDGEKSKILFLPVGEKTAHNFGNFGNYLWGATGYTVGFDFSGLQFGAHFNSIVNPGRNGYPSQWDSEDDQNSIKKGIYHAYKYNYRKVGK